jgi:hypothetical protein
LAERDDICDHSECSGEYALLVRDVPKGYTAPPEPAIARPMMRATEVGANAQIREPTRMLGLGLRESTFEDCDGDEKDVFYVEDFVEFTEGGL